MSVRLYYRGEFGLIQVFGPLKESDLQAAKRTVVEEGYELVDVGLARAPRFGAIPDYEFMRAEEGWA